MSAESRETLRSCEQKLLDWLRRQGQDIRYGALTAMLIVEYQDGVPVSMRTRKPVEIEEKFR